MISMKEELGRLQSTIELIDKINEESERQWGLMTPQHMIEHLGGILYMTSKGIDMPEALKGDQAQKAKNRFFSSFLPFEKSVPLPGVEGALPKLKYDSLDEAKDKTKKALSTFISIVKSEPERQVIHSYFGPMTLNEWAVFHRLHIEHHLMQFGQLKRDENIKVLEKLLYKISTKITADTPAEWGRMNAHQMIEHLGGTLLFSTGMFNMPYKGSEEQAQKIWTAFEKSDNPWIEVFPNINIGDPRPPRKETIEESKVEMRKSFVKYMNYCENNPDGINPHLTLGNLDVEQWRKVHVKHLRHHGRQFGLDL